MPHLSLKSKADNLSQLETRVTSAQVLPQISINYKQWKKPGNHLAVEIEKKGWQNANLIIRSSARNEDQVGTSFAGMYNSLPNKIGIAEVNKSVSEIFSTYATEDDYNQVFIQPMISSPKIQGVAFNREPSSGNDYFVLNYTDINNTTDLITNGLSREDDVIYIARCFAKHPVHWVQNVVNLLLELENIYANKFLDIEFILTQENQLVLLQVRELYTITQSPLERNQKEILAQMETNYIKTKGNSPILGVMPDWNPAEIIGICPNTLALSLYKELITNEVWAQSRVKYGYKKTNAKPLMIDFHGMPYIDVKLSFQSFLPNDLPKNISNKLINFYIKKLIKNPFLHDKIESEIVLSSSHFNIDTDVNELKRHNFSDNECQLIMSSLKSLTKNIIHPETGYWKKDLVSVQSIKDKHQLILNCKEPIQNKIIKLLGLCKNHGTLPFAGLARTAFIAKSYLKSLEEIGVFSKTDIEMFNQSTSTIVHDLIVNFNRNSKEIFLNKFGHLRPDSYNLLSLRYDDLDSNYFVWDTPTKEEEVKTFIISDEQSLKIDALLKKHSLPYQPVTFINFLREAICNREQAKFLFSLILSDILKLSECFALKENIKNKNLVYLNINQITSGINTAFLERLINNSKKEEEKRNSLILPSLITSESDFYYFTNIKNQPNFITLESVTARPINLDKSSNIFKGAIVLIKHADPGYDWIFTHEIGGLVTMFGGCNSHMAIRTAELNLPAVIGVGKTSFKQYLKAKCLLIDCRKKWVKILK